MRISVRNGDPGYFEGSYRCTVYLDGVKLDDCVTADEEEGIAICYDLTTPHAYGADIPLVTRRGDVEINTRDDDGICILCGVRGAQMHHDHCARAGWNAVKDRWAPGLAYDPSSPRTTEFAGAIVERRTVGPLSAQTVAAIREYGDRVFTGPLFASLLKPRRSIISAMHSARRARARKRKQITAQDEGVHRAISAMQKPGRANEL